MTPETKKKYIIQLTPYNSTFGDEHKPELVTLITSDIDNSISQYMRNRQPAEVTILSILPIDDADKN